ncbi:MAG: hypothetical protein NVSMB31_17650 [Vulcanimicrobiaceae bacterium]
MADQRIVGKTCRVTASVSSTKMGEVMIPVRGGTEAYMALTDDPEPIPKHASAVVVELSPPRTVRITRIS